ncbi:MAG: hypothetical protein BWY63_03645 [Chloroflexi bacterium ADurb.Bin360]|nr:MAG: hypothetical protein BWY63_03645 [Chloroflexi bacterium ADurb.Bin360]
MFTLKVLRLCITRGMCWEWARQTVALEEIHKRMREHLM